MIENPRWRLAVFLLSSFAAAQPSIHSAAEFLNLASLRSSEGRYREAEAALNQALQVSQDGQDDTTAARAWNAFGELHRMLGRYTDAESDYSQARVILESQRGTPSDLPAVLNNLGAIYRLTGRYSEADRAIRRALTIWESAPGGPHFEAAVALNNLGQLRLTQGRYEAADGYLRCSQLILESTLGPCSGSAGNGESVSPLR